MSSLIIEVCKINKIEKHPNADKLSIAEVKGWNVIVGLEQYEANDLVVFCPPDSIIPPNIIEKYNLEYLKKNGRVQTTKLRGYISQGLILDLPEGKWKEGDDVANVLGIIKYEPPEPKYSVRGTQQTSRKKINPNFHKYVEIENIKNFNDIFNEDDDVVITEKIHGANSRYGILKIEISNNAPLLDKISMWIRSRIFKQSHEFVYGSHNVQITAHSNRRSFYGNDVWGAIGQKYDIKNKLTPETILYGEVYGEGIQDLTYGIKGHDFIVFDIKCGGQYLNWEDVKAYCNNYGFKYVPELYVGKYSDSIVKQCAEGNSMLCAEQIREGCVVKMLYEQNHPRIGRKILKSINAEYLARKDRTDYQ